MPDRIQPEIPGSGPIAPSQTPAEHPQPGHEFGEHERLGQVVVSTGAEARDPVRSGILCGQEQHGCLDPLRLERLADIAAIGIRQPDVNHQQVVLLRIGKHQGFATVARQIDLESLLVEPLVEQPPELGVVLDNQDVQVHVIAASVIRSNDRWQT